MAMRCFNNMSNKKVSSKIAGDHQHWKTVTDEVIKVKQEKVRKERA
jgi:hypothetical protein